MLEVSDIGRVGGIHCPGGMPSHVENCTRMTDPRGHGLALIVGEGL